MRAKRARKFFDNFCFFTAEKRYHYISQLCLVVQQLFWKSLTSFKTFKSGTNGDSTELRTAASLLYILNPIKIQFQNLRYFCKLLKDKRPSAPKVFLSFFSQVYTMNYQQVDQIMRLVKTFSY